MFVTAVCFLFLLKLKWPKNKNISIEHVTCFLFLNYKTGEISLQGDIRPTLRANFENHWDFMEILRREVGKLKTLVF